MSLRSLSLRLLAVAVIILATARFASAHSELIRSEPADGATVATAPQQVTIEFSQLLDPAQSSITVVDAAGATVSNGQAQVPANNGKALRVALKPNLGPGVYTVQWKNFSLEDGEAFNDSFTFTVGSAQPAASGAASGQAPTGASQLPATGAATSAPLIGVGALALMLIGWALRTAWLREKRDQA